MYLYIASSEDWQGRHLHKLGCSANPLTRFKETDYPPNQTPAAEMHIYGLWETVAEDREQLMHYEHMLHSQFNLYRIAPNREWFEWAYGDFVELVTKYLNSQLWVIRPLTLNDLPKSKDRPMIRHYDANPYIIFSTKQRYDALAKVQEPIIGAICGFLLDQEERAATVVASCGIGKTIMTLQAIIRMQQVARRVVICCPSLAIQQQWKQHASDRKAFKPSEIILIGGQGLTDLNAIRQQLQRPIYCVITTYSSSHLLTELIDENTQLVVLDEAHHMAGVVAAEEKGEGRTRRLFGRSVELGIKRLSLTYTPRYLKGEKWENYLTMENTEAFGPIISEFSFRDAVKAGVLPDYRLWLLSDRENQGSGWKGKMEAIMEMWNSIKTIPAEFNDGTPHYVINKLIVFARTIQEVKEIAEYYKDRVEDTLVLSVTGNDDLGDPLKQFDLAKRAIIINCYKLGEAVDIPCADSVAIIYDKKSITQLVQMIMRAGRWIRGKTLFHVLLPIMQEEDHSTMEMVLTLLAKSDERLFDQIQGRLMKKESAGSDIKEIDLTIQREPECLIMEAVVADPEKLKEAFKRILNSRYSTSDYNWVRGWCVMQGINTSQEYAVKRSERIIDLPENPLSSGMTWYEFLHPQNAKETRISVKEFGENVLNVNRTCCSAQGYMKWYEGLSDDDKRVYPSLQHINDGFFGIEDNNLQKLVGRLQLVVRQR